MLWCKWVIFFSLPTVSQISFPLHIVTACHQSKMVNQHALRTCKLSIHKKDSGHKAPEKTRDSRKSGARLAPDWVCCVAPHLQLQLAGVAHHSPATRAWAETGRCGCFCCERSWLTSLGVSPPGGVKSRQDWPQALAAFFKSSFARPSKMPKLCIWEMSQRRDEKWPSLKRWLNGINGNVTLSLSNGSKTIWAAEQLFLRMISAVWKRETAESERSDVFLKRFYRSLLTQEQDSYINNDWVDDSTLQCHHWSWFMLTCEYCTEGVITHLYAIHLTLLPLLFVAGH